MKCYFTVVALLFSFLGFSQKQVCGFYHHRETIESMYPESKKAREDVEAQILKQGASSRLKKMGVTSEDASYKGRIYDIPIVVHVIESSDPSNASVSLTDDQIIDWIDKANRIFATTFGGNYYPEGPGAEGGSVFPFRLVLAKRTKECTPTTGIVRYNGSSIPGYDQYGVRFYGENGALINDIYKLAPHWDESAYFNIYLIASIDGERLEYGITGWSGDPSQGNSRYDSFIKAMIVKSRLESSASTLVHEFGHATGLDHPSEGASSSSECPPNDNCKLDNDKVCDTDPIKVYDDSLSSDINPCTGVSYGGVQYNIMHYGQKRKFTPGQRERALAVFMATRENLTKSLGATEIAEDSATRFPIPAVCNPTEIYDPDNYGAGPRSVVLGNINNPTDYNRGPQFYIDYSKIGCINESVYTDIPSTTPSEIVIGFGGFNRQTVKAWIDYNNDGAFDSSEMIADSESRLNPSESPFKASFTPPPSAVKNVYLRLRVRVDLYEDGDACSLIYGGQIEDYAVRIVENPTLSTGENSIVHDNPVVVYNESMNEILLAGTKGEFLFGEYKIYDMSGKVLQIGNSKTKKIQLKNNLPNGTYIVTFNMGNKKAISKKFIK